MRAKKKLSNSSVRHAAVTSSGRHSAMLAYTPQDIIEMEMIVMSLARDEHPWDFQSAGHDQRKRPTGIWCCRYCFAVHPAQHDASGWPDGSKTAKLTHGTDCSWYWSRIFAAQHPVVNWPTEIDPRQTQPAPQVPPLYRRLRKAS